MLGPLTDVEKLRCLTLAPTAKLESKESLFEVAGALLLPSGCTYPDKTSFTAFMVDRFTEVGIAEKMANTYINIYDAFCTTYTFKLKWSLFLKETEAAGVPVLCDFVASVVEGLHLEFHPRSFTYSMKYVLVNTKKLDQTLLLIQQLCL